MSRIFNVKLAMAAIFILIFMGTAMAQDSARVELHYATTDFQYVTSDTLIVEVWVKSSDSLNAFSLGFVESRALFDIDTFFFDATNVGGIDNSIYNKPDTVVMGNVYFPMPGAKRSFPKTDVPLRMATIRMIYKADSLAAITSDKQQFFLDSSFFPPAGNFIVTNTGGVSVNPTLTNDTIQLGISKVFDINPGMIPAKFELSQNFPNPFNPDTKIQFAIPQTGQVNLAIYNIMGQKVRTLVNEVLDAGYKEIIWNGHDDYGQEVASGVYLYKIQAGNFNDSKKMTLVK